MISWIKAFSDNYIYLIDCGKNENGKDLFIVVDPGNAQAVLSKLNAINGELYAIFITHHHSDHTGGINELVALYPNISIYGGDSEKRKIPNQSIFLKDGDLINTPAGDFTVLHIPGHTLGHIAYYLPASKHEAPHLFCGDTLFGATCGNIFEGTKEQMYASLLKIKNLPQNTLIWCAHEYTLMGLEFAAVIEPNNKQTQARLVAVRELTSHNIPTIPLLLATERATNPYLRWDSPDFQQQFSTVGKDLETFLRIIELG